MKLNNRLTTIASFVTSGAILVDIGCDHGYLCIELAKNDKISHAYASDVNQGPLNNVINNVNREQMNEKVSCILSDGLEQFNNIEFSDLVVAGMGGSLIVEIISKNLSLLTNKTLILQPNNNSYALRKYLIDNHLNIINEQLVEDSGIIYEVLVAQTGISKQYNELELLFGKFNLERKDSILNKFLNEYLSKQEFIYSNIPDEHENKTIFEKRIKLVKEFYNENY